MEQSREHAARMKAACELLANTRRRYLLYQLVESGPRNVEELSTQIAAWENESSLSSVSREDHQQVYISLVHNHLPRLADYDIIDYDIRSGDVVCSDGFDDIQKLLEQFRQTEERPESLTL